MLSILRIEEIISILKSRNAVTVKELADKYYASQSTIRRDLDKLEKMGIVKKTYGGAVLIEGINSEIPLLVRENEQKGAKDTIARLASRLVENGMALLLDSSSTVLHIVPYLRDFERLTVITNGAKTAVECASLRDAKIYSTGGLLRENSLSYIGQSAQSSVSRFCADLLFFSCRAISPDKGLTDISEEEAVLRSMMIKNAKKAVLLMDGNKFDNVSFCRIDGGEDIDVVITDKRPSEVWEEYFRQRNIQLIYR
ncbi:MAG: DeoR/GlpR family DNA-binding transcription regulator [Eubacteriales bacterium]